MNAYLLPDDYRKPGGSRYLSGTEWEYEDAVASATVTVKPLVIAYRRTEEPIFKPSDPEFMQKYEQRQRMQSFSPDSLPGMARFVPDTPYMTTDTLVMRSDEGKQRAVQVQPRNPR